VLLQLKDINKSIGVTEILGNISFMVQEKEKVALVGVNGAGKTSIFRLLTGEWQPDEGHITMPQGMTLGYLPQAPGSEPLRENTQEASAHDTQPGTEGMTLYDALDAVFAPLKQMEQDMRALESQMAALTDGALETALKKYDRLSIDFKDQGGFEMASRLKGVLKGLGFEESQWVQDFATLSGGERTRAMLGKLLLGQADLLLLDEPTNHLDIESVKWLEEYLKTFPKAVLLISHDRYFMDKVVTKVIEIEHRKSKTYSGNYSFFVQKKATDRALAEKQFAEQQKVIKHHEEVIKTIRSFRTEAAIIRAKSREKMLDKIERIDAPAQDPASMKLRLTPTLNSGHDVLFAEELTMGFHGQPLFSGLSIDIKKGDKTALIGANGTGKTTLLKILVGQLTPQSGHIRPGVNVRIGYYDQNTALDNKKTIFQELADSYPRLTQTAIRSTLAAFMFIGDDVFKPIATLSGGERGRVQLAKIMLTGANFLVLDEPTNHLDIFSKEILEEALRDFTGTLLYISHDRYFINNTANKILDLTPTALATYNGNYDYYTEKKSEQENHPPTPLTKEPQKLDYRQRKEEESRQRKAAARLERIEKTILETEAHITHLEAKLSTDEIGRDAEKANEIFSEKTKLEENLAELYDEWEDLQE